MGRKKTNLETIVKALPPSERASPDWIINKIIDIIEVCADPANADAKLFNPMAALKGLELLGKRTNLFEPKQDEGQQILIPFIEVNINTPARATSEDQIQD